MKDKRSSTLIVVLMTSFITTFTGSALNLSVPAISRDFNAGAVSISWVVTGYIISSALLSIPFGRFADVRGRKPVLVTGEIIFTACSVLCALSWNIISLTIFRLIQGIGASMMFATNTAILVSSYPSESRGKMLGLSVSATYLGLSLGPVAGGVINQHLGWRAVFFITAVYCAIMTLIAFYGLEEPRNDYSETVCINHISDMDKTATRERFTDLFRNNRPFVLSNIAAFINYGSCYVVSYLMSIYLQNVQGFSSQMSGLILITSPVFQTLLSPVAGRSSDRISPYRLAALGMAITASGMFMFIFVSETTSIGFVIGALAVTGLGSAIFSSPNSNAIMSRVSERQYSTASSVISSSRSLGNTASMTAVSGIVSVTVGNITLAEASPASIVYAIHLSFIIFTVFCAAGIYCSAKQN